MYKKTALAFAASLLIFPVTAYASDDGAEFWLNPSVSVDVDDNTGLEIETAQRFRDAGEGRADTYFVRLWVNQKIADNVTLSGAFESRVNDGASNETRLIQQMTTKHGILRTRLRLEQRFVEDADRMGLRIRPRIGAAIPLGDDGKWTFKSDAELFFTLRGNNRGSSTGLTGLRTQVGLAYDLSDRISLSAAYLRQQDIRNGRPDTIGHAPIIGIEYSF
ncbi:DUF2490 domain-containing protein [Sphingorhabdus arenilitoris]|uniref:DUF2490 domain-containing protein n=1 Tax=Sphingorhabdus arenilitoris TaxID=1490041 RepID=A0ABV8RCS1_9SPHN